MYCRSRLLKVGPAPILRSSARSYRYGNGAKNNHRELLAQYHLYSMCVHTTDIDLEHTYLSYHESDAASSSLDYLLVSTQLADRLFDFGSYTARGHKLVRQHHYGPLKNIDTDIRDELVLKLSSTKS